MRSTRPVISECSFQPPRSSASTVSPTASEASGGLPTAMIAPLRITVKSERQAYQADEPKHWPSMADTHGLSRSRTYWCGSWPSCMAMPRAPMLSGMRAPDDSPKKTSGKPRSVATRLTWPILRMLVMLDEAPLTVKSFETTPIVRPSNLAKPVILPSAGVDSRSPDSSAETPSKPASSQEPSSMSRSMRSRALRRPLALRRASLSGPPMPRARFSSASSSARRCALLPVGVSFFLSVMLSLP